MCASRDKNHSTEKLGIPKRHTNKKGFFFLNRKNVDSKNICDDFCVVTMQSSCVSFCYSCQSIHVGAGKTMNYTPRDKL